jgi:uncharacterized membrane protein YhaH (DUF805 family)
MDIVAAITTCLRKSADFRSRARRSEFWSFIAFWVVMSVLCVLAFEPPKGPSSWALQLLLNAPILLIPLVLLLPLAAVAVRRLHDIGLSGWWLLSAGVPIPVVDILVVGAQVYCFARPGTAGDNRYGPDPRG